MESKFVLRNGVAAFWAVAVILAAVVVTPGQAAPSGDESALRVSFFIEPILQKGFGGTSYDLSFSGGSGSTGLSRLEFPQISLEAGAAAGIVIYRGGKREWMVEVSGAYSALPISGTMNDYDWVQYSIYPKIPFSYTYSTDSAVSWHASVEFARTITSAGPWSFAVYWTYRYQQASHVEDSAIGWQYVWNTTANAYDLYLISDPTLDVLEYSIWTHILGLGFMVDLEASPEFLLELRAAYTPVYVSDRDDHKLRTKLSTASGWGNGFYGNLRAVYKLRQIGAVTPYLALEGEIIYSVVSTTQTQYWYGNADAANGAPQGTTYTGVPHDITTSQYEVGLRLGFQF